MTKAHFLVPFALQRPAGPRPQPSTAYLSAVFGPGIDPSSALGIRLGKHLDEAVRTYGRNAVRSAFVDLDWRQRKPPAQASPRLADRFAPRPRTGTPAPDFDLKNRSDSNDVMMRLPPGTTLSAYQDSQRLSTQGHTRLSSEGERQVGQLRLGKLDAPSLEKFAQTVRSDLAIQLSLEALLEGKPSSAIAEDISALTQGKVSPETLETHFAPLALALGAGKTPSNESALALSALFAPETNGPRPQLLTSEDSVFLELKASALYHRENAAQAQDRSAENMRHFADRQGGAAAAAPEIDWK